VHFTEDVCFGRRLVVCVEVLCDEWELLERANAGVSSSARARVSLMVFILVT
jgi:hypothetical protein